MTLQSRPPHELPKVAVLTPIYNGEAYLRETMQCVQAQTYTNLIHVVIDNASTDKTAAILAEFENDRVPLKIVRHKTLLPQMENWNSAIDAIPEGTDWFRILCADDTIQPEAIEKTVALGETDPEIGLVGCKHDINGAVQDALWPTDQSIFDGKHALTRFFENEGMIIGPHVLIRTKAIPTDKPFFDLVENAADTDAALRVLTEWKMGFVHEHLAFTRVHDTTVTELEVSPLKLYLFDWYLFLHRYAEAGLGAEMGKAMLTRYRRHYLRRLLNIRRTDSNGHAIWNVHMQRLKRIDQRFRSADFVSAVVDRGLIRAGVRENWFAYPW